jgi:hypothetical protein
MGILSKFVEQAREYIATGDAVQASEKLYNIPYVEWLVNYVTG